MKKQMESQPGGGGVLEMEDRSGIEIKKPKAGKWVKQSDPAAAGIQDVTCPDGSTENLELVPDP